MNLFSSVQNNIVLAALVRRTLFFHSKIKFMSSRRRDIHAIAKVLTPKKHKP